MFENIEHTADLGLRVRAEDLNALVADVARGMFSLIEGATRTFPPRPRTSGSVSVD